MRLSDASSGQPIPGAAITLFQSTLPRPKFYKGVTGAEGVCRIENVAPGSYLVTTQKLGYVYWSRQIQVTVNPGTTAEVKTSLQPTALATGAVLGEDNEPLAGVAIYATPQQGNPLHGESGADGRYRIENIPPGPVRFRLVVPSARMKAALRVDKATGERWTYPASSFHPGGVESVSQATPVVFAPGGTLAEFDLRLRRVRLAEFKGRIVDAVSRLPLTAAEVELQPVAMPGTTDEAFVRRAVAGANAEFHFAFVRPGSYRMLVFRDDRYRMLPYSTAVEVGPPGLLDYILQIPPFGRLTGRLKKAGSTGDQALDGARISLQGGGEIAEATVRTTGPPGADGVFTFENVPPGPVMLSASFKDGRSFIRRVAGGAGPVESAGFGHLLFMPEGGLEIELEVSGEAGSVAGRVLDDKDNPVPNAIVRIAGGPPRFPIQTDQFGNFRVEGVPPGKHELFACLARKVEVEVQNGSTASAMLRDCAKP